MPDGSTHPQRTSLDLAALLKPSSPTTPMEAVVALIVGMGLPTDEALDRYIALEIDAERGRLLAHQREAGRSSGVRFGGTEPDAWAGREPENLVADARLRKMRADDFAASPRGRLIRALHELGTLGWNEAETVLSIYSRSLAAEDQPVDARFADAVGRAVRILIEIHHSHAREAIAALADLLAPPLAMAA